MRLAGDQNTTAMLIQAQIAVFGGFFLMLTEGRTYRQADPHIEMRGCI